MKFEPRRPYEDDKPDGYMESDDDFFHNNRFLAIGFLEILEKELVGDNRAENLVAAITRYVETVA